MSQSTKPTTNKPASKRAMATKVFNTIKRRKAPKRRDFINAMIEKCGLSKNGAATYYYNLTSGPWSNKKVSA